MSFATLYRLSFYLMLVFATLTLSIDAGDGKVTMLYPVGVAAGAVVAFLTVDRRPGAGVSRSWSNFLGFVALALMGLEFAIDRTLLLLALGHWLVYLQLVYMFRPKSVENDWWMFGLGLWQVLVGTVISQQDKVGMMLFCWALLALWVLGLFSLQRDAYRASRTAEGPSWKPADPYPGLLNSAFLFSGLRVTLTTLALGGVIFLAMPRRISMTRAPRGNVPSQHLTGFDDEVQLGQLGEILENDSVVMSVEMFDEKDARIAPEGESLLRGVTMAIYENGRWFRQSKGSGSRFFPLVLPEAVVRAAESRATGIIRQSIKLESNDSIALFGLRPMIEATSNTRFPPELNTSDGSIYRSDPRSGPYDYEVRSLKVRPESDEGVAQVGEYPPNFSRKNDLRGIPEGMRPRLRQIALGVIEKALPPEDRDDLRKKARVLERHLRDSGEFAYTLKLERDDRDLDPVLDFLINRKQGHCEYFASALVLLLRSVDVPARMVNGFKGGDWNEIARVLSVRQKHAHSWVEAYLGDTPGPNRAPLWLTLDPTPGNERDASVARVSGFSGNFRQVTDLIRYVWVFYVVGYNAERQSKLLYTPIRRLVSEAQRGFRIIADALKAGYARLVKLLTFRTAQSFFSVRGFGVSFGGLFLLSGLVWLVRWAVRRVFRRFGPGDDGGPLSAGAAHYRRLAQLLSEYGLVRPAAETQDEFARRAAAYLASRGSTTEAVTEVPRFVVDAFYRVRFGRRELSADDLEALETRLDTLETSLRASAA